VAAKKAASAETAERLRAAKAGALPVETPVPVAATAAPAAEAAAPKRAGRVRKKPDATQGDAP
jgi:hypothetical protein